MFADYFDGLKNERLESLAELNRKSLPIVMYGAGEYSQLVERFLRANGLTVAARFVDANYPTPPGVTHFDDVEQRFTRFSVVLGMADSRSGSEAMNRRGSGKVDGVYRFVLSTHYLAAIDLEFVRRNATRLGLVYDALSDELSRRSFLGYLKAQVTGNDQFLLDTFCPDQYFQGFVGIGNEEIFADAGAYVGDTLEEFLRVTRGQYRKYYAFEPDPANFRKLTEFAKQNDVQRLETFGCGVGSKQGMLRFSQEGRLLDASKICDTGNLTISIETIDRTCPDATFIKMDIEGAELDALEGAMQTIRTNLPKLAVCAYHKPSHLWELVNYVRSLVPEYRIYFRQHHTMSKELVMYAVVS